MHKMYIHTTFIHSEKEKRFKRFLKNSVFIASDLMDSDNGETLVYNVEDPDEIELM